MKSSLPSSSSFSTVLHFDINETVLLGDIAGGDSVEESLHKIIAKSALVRVPDTYQGTLADFVPTHWRNGTPIASSSTSTNEKNGKDRDIISELWTQAEWPRQTAPYYRTAFKRKAKTFLEHDGKIYQSVKQQIPLPPNTGLFAHLLPALFATLHALSCANHGTVRIVFRTMGHDLPYVASAVTAFAQGKHPDYPNFFHEPYVWDQSQQFMKAQWKENDIFALQDNIGTTVADGDAAVLQHLRQFTICGIQDNYHHWKQGNFHAKGGKPVWKDENEHHVLFDDNIFPLLPEDSIAGIRQNDQFVSGSEHGIHLIPVRTLAPLCNPQWFLESLEQSRSNFEQAYIK